MTKRQNTSGDASADLAPCDFSLLCSKSWAELRPTLAKDVRYCDRCKRDVFKIISRAQLEEARSLGRCVAWARPATHALTVAPR